MTDFFWAGITISFLAVLGAFNSRKGRYLRRHNPNLAKINLGLILFCGWAGLNFVQNLMPVKEHVGTSLLIIMDSLATALLLGAGLLMAITWTLAVPNLKNWLLRDRGLQSAIELGEAIANIPIADGSRIFLRKTAEIVAGHVHAGYYSIEYSANDRNFDILEQYLISDRSEIQDIPKYTRTENVDSAAQSERSITIPIKIDDGAYNLIFHLSSGRRHHFPEKWMAPLRAIISARMRDAIHLENIESRTDILDIQNDLFALVGRDSDLALYLQDVFHTISEKLPVDYISVAVLDGTVQNMYRYTYAEVGGSLIERGVCYPLKQTAALKVAREKRMLIANTLESDFYRDDYHLYKSGFSSRLVYPLSDDSDMVKGVLTLATVKPRAFNDIPEEDLEFLNLPLCRMIEMHNVTSMMNTLKKQVVSSFNLTFGLENGMGLNEFYNNSARILAETLPATMCRIWGMNHQDNSLESIGFYSLHDKAESGDFDSAKIGLELMPRHKAAISMGKAIIVNQSNPEYSMDKSELKAMGLPGVKSAILAPMRLQNRVFGIVSVGEVRNWERRSLGQQELLYSQIISTITALVREIDQKTLEVNSMRNNFIDLEKKSRIYETYPNLPSKLSSPLSSLMGAAQLIRKRLPEDAAELIRYNEIILKGAENMMKEFRKFEEVKNSLA